MTVLNFLAFRNSRGYFIYFNTLLYNTLNIKGLGFLPLHLNIISLLFFLIFLLHLSLSLCFSFFSQAKITNKPTTHGHCHYLPQAITPTSQLPIQPSRSSTKLKPALTVQPRKTETHLQHKLKPKPPSTTMN